MDYENLYDHLVRISVRADKNDLLLACAKCLYCIPLNENPDPNNPDHYAINEKEAKLIQEKILKHMENETCS